MRKVAREIVFKLIYESEFNKDRDVELSFSSMLENEVLSNEDKKFVETLLNLYETNKVEIEEKIETALIGYEKNRVYKIDLAILAVAIAEIDYFLETPVAVVVNEAVELGKKYSTDNSSKFINGILSTLLKK